MQQQETFHIRSKIWIEDKSGDVVFGLGRLKIFDAIDRLGSIQGAAKELKMSYRAIWGRIKATEERLNRPLLIRGRGGRKGGGSRLTPFALTLLIHFRHLHHRITILSDRNSKRSWRPISNRTKNPWSSLLPLKGVGHYGSDFVEFIRFLQCTRLSARMIKNRLTFFFQKIKSHLHGNTRGRKYNVCVKELVVAPLHTGEVRRPDLEPAAIP